MQNAHVIVSVQPKAAPVHVMPDGEVLRGLDGYEAVCSCGFRSASSLGERWARRQGEDHAAYMNAKEAA
ncbi:hypothetical protein [Mycolicibacterium sp.]|uniref:hypothetical protein n=1 Tax=Mycolicibacterium sp. TaxID=2320850 RepID=UPI0037C703F5